MNEVFGLKEIRFIYSGDFVHETVDISTSTLLLGSSGVGKTTVMSACSYFYTMDKDKTRPDNQDKTFYQWHLSTPYSHVIYKYTNDIGDNLLVLSIENGKPKHTFINIHNYPNKIETLYLDEEGNPLELKELLENCSINELSFHKAETFTHFKKLLHKQEYRTLKEKDKPLVDFSLFKDIESAKVFSEHLFKIYRSSSIHDSTIKNMLISMIDTNENRLNILDFQSKLSSSLDGVEQIELLKKKRTSILELDSLINTYKNLLANKSKIADSLFEVNNNKTSIEEFILGRLGVYTKELRELEEKVLDNEKQKNKVVENYVQDISNAILSIEALEKKEKQYITENLEEKLLEQNKEDEYRLEKEKLSARFEALNSDVKDSKSKEEEQKKKVELEFLIKKAKEEKSLNKEFNRLNTERVTSLQKSKEEIKEKTEGLDTQYKVLAHGVKELSIELTGKRKDIEHLPKQEIKNNSIIYLTKIVKELEQQLSEVKTRLESTGGRIELQKKKYVELLEKLHHDRENEVAKYYEEKKHIESEIEKINIKLNFDKENLYGYINRANYPYKKEILAITKDELLFKENLEISETKESSLYGINIINDLSELTNQYDVEMLEGKKNDFVSKKDVLVAQHNININKIDEKTRGLEKERSKELKTLSREKHKLESELIRFNNDFNARKKELNEEILLEREKVQKKIIDFKEEIKVKEEECNTLEQDANAVMDNLNSLKNELELKQKQEQESLEKNIADVNKKMSELDYKYKELLEESFKQIELEFAKVRQEQNIDDVELKTVDKQLKNIHQRISNINSYRVIVSEYLRTKPEIENLSQKRDNVKALKKKKDEEEEKYSSVQKKLQDKQGNVQEKINNWKQRQDDFQSFVKKVSNLLLNSTIVGDVFSDEDIDAYMYKNYFLELISDFERYQEDIKNRVHDIRHKTESLTRGIPQNNILNLRTCNMDIIDSDSIESYISIANDYIRYVKEELDIQGASLQLRALSETINAAVSQIKHIEEDINIIAYEVRKINNMLKTGVAGIRVIDHIQLNYLAYTSNELLNQIKRTGDLLDEEFVFLFNNDEKAEKVKEKIVDQAKYLKNLLDKDFSKSFSVSDMSKLSFNISENEKIHSNLATLNTIGSNGTTIMVKTIIYLTLLKKVSSKFDSRLKLHCILDEIGQISADFFAELLKYATELGFSFLNGTAANDEDLLESYKNIYIGTRNGNKTEISRVIVEDMLDKEVV